MGGKETCWVRRHCLTGDFREDGRTSKPLGAYRKAWRFVERELTDQKTV